MVEVSLHFREEGEPVLGRELIPVVIRETPEMLWCGTASDAALRIIKSTEDNDRWEVTARTPEGVLVGYAVVVPDFDSNIGPVAGVQWLFVLPEFRHMSVLMGIYQGIVTAAHYEELDVLAYTRRLGLGRYELTYKRIGRPAKDGQEDQEGREEGRQVSR
ncbi:hypothetical protein [Pseudomonas guariconensis]|uniref:hypothetical protein n=1 Tax=Pseudomonas guariconensis TaxID=1288410 RepID=UPI002B05DFF0|nr:hypothetical protein [Pseudomonas guariconensis]